jgi:hypothetical protein
MSQPGLQVSELMECLKPHGCTRVLPATGTRGPQPSSAIGLRHRNTPTAVNAVSYGCELMYFLRAPKTEVEDVVVVVEAEVGFGPIFAVWERGYVVFVVWI